MAKPKAPPPPVPEWPTGERSVGKTLYRKIANLAITREEHRKAGDKNHLAIEGLDYEIAQVQMHLEAIVRTLVLDQMRIDRAAEEGGEGQKAKAQAKDGALMPDVEKCLASLKDKGMTASIAAVEREWARQRTQKLITADCPGTGKLRELVNSSSRP